LTRPRKHETKADIAATLILQHCKDGAGCPIVTREQAKGMSADQIIREWRKRVIRQHGAAHATGGLDHPANYWFTLREVDAVETPRDISRIAKGKRLERRQAEFRQLCLSKAGQATEIPLPARKKHRWPKRSFAQQRGARP